MAFYADLLREDGEFLGNPGFDDDAIVGPNDEYTQDLKDIAKAVEDINDKQAEESSEVELDGQDIREESFTFMYESQYNWNRIMQAIGEAELTEAVKGRELVMESVDIKGFFGKVKQFFVERFQKLTTMVKGWIEQAKEKYGKNRMFLAKNKDNIVAGHAMFDKTFKGFEFAHGKFGTDAEFAKQCGKAFDALKADMSDKVAECSAAAEKGDMSGLKEKLTGAYNDEFEANQAKYIGLENKDNLHDYFDMGNKVELTKTSGCMQPDYIIDILEMSSKAVQMAKGPYASAKACYSSIVKDLNKLEKVVGKQDVSVEQQAVMTVCTQICNQARKNQNLAHSLYTQMLHSMNVEAGQARKVANAYVALATKSAKADAKTEKKAAKAQQESASYMGAGFLAGINMNMI